MIKRIISASVASIFVFLLGMTAADYCGPQPKQPRLETQAALAKFNQIKFKKAHHPCASLKNPYDLVSTFRVSAQEILKAFKFLISIAKKSFLFEKHFFANDSSPPFVNPPPQAVPIFQLNSNLRI